MQVTLATTTCASRVSALVGHRKRPPVQVTVATTTCASRVSALVGHRKRPPVQVTVAPGQHMHAPFAPPHVPESECAQWLKKKTTSASYSRAVPAPPPLECTLQQAIVTCLRACHWISSHALSIQWHSLRQAYICLLQRALQWRRCRYCPAVTCAGGLFLQPLSAFTFWHMWWCEWCVHVLAWSHCNLHWWSFSMTN